MTAPQRRVLDAVHALSGELGHPPTVREVSWRCGYASASTTHAILQSLRHAGLVTWSPSATRTLLITDRGRVFLGVAS